ncbi:hypothetical protein [Cellulomonas sp. PhB150]|uniref:hypothetical protein n=1 Tax=Cellulomonas sp. PhB150 TaxID=2485188 RepID=UPI000F45F687|nr:hypothetical protein [Cellulomonas sp. PhB150]ROS30431.1 hypothetical protein EDF34_0068 [Cellulomonas sp. PhB150]
MRASQRPSRPCAAAVSLVLVVGALTAATATAAQSAAADPIDQGDLYPLVVPGTVGVSEVAYADDSMFVDSDDPRLPAGSVYEVRDTATGTLLRTIPRDPADPYEQGVAFRHGVVVHWDETHATADDLRTGERLWSLTAPGGETIRFVRDDGVVTSAGGQVHVVTPDGADIVVTDGTSARPIETDVHPVEVRTPDGDELVLDSGSATWTVDPDTGVATKVTTVNLFQPVVRDGVLYGSAALGPATLAQCPLDGSGCTFASRAPGDTDSWFDVLGAGKIVEIRSPNGSARQVRLLTLADGALSHPTDWVTLAGVRITPSGTLVVSRDDGNGGTYATTTDLSTVTDLVRVASPTVLASATWLGSDDVLVVQDAGAAPGPYLWARGWGAGYAFAPSWGGQTLDGTLTAVAGQVVETTVTSYRTTTATLTWPGGSRSFDTSFWDLGLEADGRYWVRGVLGPEGGVDFLDVSDARTGDLVRRIAWDQRDEIVVTDGAWWAGPDASGVLRRYSLATGAQTGTLASGLTCLPSVRHELTVAGRWLLVTCGTENAAVVDTDGVYRPWRLPTSVTSLADLRLGDGFVVGTRSDHAGHAAVELTSVVDPAQHRIYGPVRSQASVLGTRRVRYTDDHDRARVVTPTWLPAPVAATDRTAPTVTTPRVPALSATTSITATWTGVDPVDPTDRFLPSGVAAYDVQHQVAARGASLGAWSAPVRVATNRTTVSVPAGGRVCVRVRAIDRVGTVGAWSAAGCGAVDGTAPRASMSEPLSALALARDGRAAIRALYSGTDDVAVASYDVRYTATPPGSATGPWVYPGSWQATTAANRTLSVAAGRRACFAVRARDAAGNVGAWSPSRCTYVDGEAPRFTTATASPRFAASATAGTVTFRYRAADDDRVSTYDVQYRTASKDSALGDWHWLPGGRLTTDTTAHRAITPGHELCFRARARDYAGHTSAWTGSHCGNVDRSATSLTRSGGARVAWDSTETHRVVLLGGTAAKAAAPHAVAGHAVSFVARTGPGQGTVKVYAGKHVIGSVTLTSRTSGWKRFTVRPSQTFSGTVAFRTTGRTVQIRGWSVAR